MLKKKEVANRVALLGRRTVYDNNLISLDYARVYMTLVNLEHNEFEIHIPTAIGIQFLGMTISCEVL